MRARGQSVLGSISRDCCDGNTLSAQVQESALNMQCHRWRGEWERAREREKTFAFGLRNPLEVTSPPVLQLDRNPCHIKLRAGLGPTTCKAAQKLQIRFVFGFFFSHLFPQFFVTLQRQLVRSKIKFMTRQLVQENHTLSSSSCQDFIKLSTSKDSKACPICQRDKANRGETWLINWVALLDRAEGTQRERKRVRDEERETSLHKYKYGVLRAVKKHCEYPNKAGNLWLPKLHRISHELRLYQLENSYDLKLQIVDKFKEIREDKITFSVSQKFDYIHIETERCQSQFSPLMHILSHLGCPPARVFRGIERVRWVS